MKVKVFLLSLCVPAFSLASTVDHPLVKDFPISSVFEQKSKLFEKVGLVAGKINYLEKEGGYQASLKLDAQGESSVFVNDYRSDYSSVHIYEEMLQRLEKNAFEVLYTCNEAQCGDVSGWQLYLSDRIMGDELSQHYVLAKQKGNKGNEWFVQFYVIDLDGEPRSYFRILNAVDRPALKLAFNKELLSIDAVDPRLATLKDIPNILFRFNEAELTGGAESYLDSIQEELLRSGIKRFVVIGYTDNSGDEQYNQMLSRKRAQAVANALKALPKLSSVDITVKFYGEKNPVADNATSEGRQKNRRVSIQYIKEETPSSTQVEEAPDTSNRVSLIP